MGVNVGTAIAFLDLDMSGFKRGISSAGADLKNFASTGNMQSLSSGLNGVGSELTTKVTLPIAGIGAAATKASMDFEAQMSKVQAISGATGEDLGNLRDQAIQLGADTNFSASEAAAGMELFASAGFKTNEIMAAMPGILDTAAAGGVSIAQATDVAASALNGFGMAASDVGHIGDVLAKFAGDTNAGIMDTGEAMKYIAPVSKALGISFEDTAAAIGLLSNAGIKGSQAGTVLRGALTNLAAPTDKAAQVMESLGMNFFDANGKMLPMADILGILKDKTSGLTQQQKASTMETLFGKEAMSGMLALVDQGPEKFTELTQSLTNCDGASKEMAGVMSNNLQGALNAMEGSLETAAIKIGDVLAPMIKGAATWIGEMANKFSALPKPMQEFIVKFALVAAAIGPVLIILAKLIESVRTVISVFTGITRIATIASSLPALMSAPILMVVGIIGLIAGAVYLIYKNWDTLKVYFQTFITFLKNLFNGFLEFIKWIFNGIGSAVKWIIDGIGSMCNSIGDFFNKSLEGWKAIWSNFTGFMSSIGTNICEGLLNGLTAGWDWVMDKVHNMVDSIKKVFTGGLGIFSPSRVFKGYGVNIGEGLTDGIDSHQGVIENKFGGLADKIKSLGNVKPDFSGLSNSAINGNFTGAKGVGVSNTSARQFNFTPTITMHVNVADTGAKGTAQLTNELRSMAQSAIKNSLVNEFMSDALRL